MKFLFFLLNYLEKLFFLCTFVAYKKESMKSTYKLLLVVLLLSLGVFRAKADVDANRIFHTITASDGIADNSAQTIKCTFTGRMTITTIGNINFYDGSNFSQINTDKECIYKLEDYQGHYHLYYDNNHHLWLKSKHGVTCVNLTTESYISNMDSLMATYGANGRVDDMFVDINGDVWLCTKGYIFNIKHGKKIALKKNLNLQDIEVYDKRLFMMFYENGQFACYDLLAGRKLFQNSAYGAEDAKIYANSGVQLIYEHGIYMIRNGEVGAILMHFDVDKRKWSEVMRSNYHLNNMVVHDKKLYIASEWGFFTYDLENGDIVHHKAISLEDGRKLETDINAIEFDLQGGMWIGTEKRGLLYAPPLTTSFTTYTWDKQPALEYEAMMRPLTGISEFKGKKANVIFIDSRNWTWVGTQNGLYLYKSPKSEPVVYSRRNGFLNSVIHAVIEDDMHNIWVSTSYGISCLYIKDSIIKKVFFFSERDNVPNETFFDAKALKLPSGEIVMQAIDHVVKFNPKNFVSLFEQEPYQMHLKLTKLLVNGINVSVGDKVDGKVVLDKAITRTKEINLDYSQNSISMTFSALNYARPLQTYYRIRIREIGNKWQEYSYFNGNGLVDRKGLLHLPLLGLQPGTYHVEVFASIVPGQFVGKPYEWVINVKQPWWRTTGIIALFGLVLLTMAVLNFIVYNRNMRMRIRRSNEEGDVIRRIKSFADRCTSFNNEKLSPTQEEIYGTDKDSQIELNSDFVEVMLKVLPYVRQLEGKPFTMHMLSNETGMEVLDLYEMISENIHKSPRALVRSMRIDQVADLLRTTNKTIEEISEVCGFVSPNYMIAKFYHKFKMTPNEFREKLV